MVQISIEQYANKYGNKIQQLSKRKSNKMTRQAILYRIKHKIELPFVSDIKKVGRSYVLTIQE